MEKHKCKLCLRSFANGRALGGHMRSHMMNLPVPPKQSEFVPIQLSFEAESSPSQSSSSFYGLRENPKKNFRFADPEFSFAAAETSSVILQDRESETESSRNPTRRRSKRAWQQLGGGGGSGGGGGGVSDESEKKMMKVFEAVNKNNNESASSVSDTTTEEDMAFCLMMLSRDKWKENNKLLYDNKVEVAEYNDDYEDEEDEDEEEEDEEGYESEEELKSVKKSNKVQGRYKCETCEKVFRSYQALGGHRASHKKIKLNNGENKNNNSNKKNNNNNEAEQLEVQHVVVVEKKIHECPVCFRVFASGQALGGHKRTHVIGSSTAATKTATATVSVRNSVATVSVRTTSTTTRVVGDSLIDLNLPAPMDDDDEEEEGDVSQFDDSAVSDAEFVKL